MHPATQDEFVSYIRSTFNNNPPMVKDQGSDAWRPMTPTELDKEARLRADGTSLQYVAGFQNARRVKYQALAPVHHGQGNLNDAGTLEQALIDLKHADKFMLGYCEKLADSKGGAHHNVLIMRLRDNKYHVIDSRDYRTEILEGDNAMEALTCFMTRHSMEVDGFGLQFEYAVADPDQNADD